MHINWSDLPTAGLVVILLFLAKKLSDEIPAFCSYWAPRTLEKAIARLPHLEQADRRAAWERELEKLHVEGGRLIRYAYARGCLVFARVLRRRQYRTLSKDWKEFLHPKSGCNYNVLLRGAIQLISNTTAGVPGLLLLEEAQARHDAIWAWAKDECPCCEPHPARIAKTWADNNPASMVTFPFADGYILPSAF